MEDLLAKFEGIAGEFNETLEVAVLEHKFVLKGLSADEDTQAHEAANPFSNIAYLYALKVETLARCIVSIDGNTIPDSIPTGKSLADHPEVWRRVPFLKRQLGKMPQEVVDFLYHQYGQVAESIGVKVNPNHPLKTGFFEDASPKELASLGETDAREFVSRESEVGRLAETEGASNDEPGS